MRASVTTNLIPHHSKVLATERVSRFQTAAESICVHARPHPNPLPQERENHSAVSGEFGRDQTAVRLEAKSEAAERAAGISMHPASADCCPLYLGEKSGMRASVQIILDRSFFEEFAFYQRRSLSKCSVC